MDDLAHTADVGGRVEPELLVFGIVLVFLAVLFRPSQMGNARASVITLVVGIALIIGSVTIPARAQPKPGAPSFEVVDTAGLPRP